ncbi:glycosyltransferase family 4 protein [Vibrio splendidus]
MNNKKKVLSVCNYISNDKVKCFARNKTGYGYVVNDIIFADYENVQMEAFTFSGSYNEFKHNSVFIHGNKCFSRLCYFNIENLVRACSYICQSFSKESIRTAFSILSEQYYRRILAKNDVVHVHGCTPNLLVMINLALKMDKKVVVTLHGLNSFSEHNKANLMVRRAERELLDIENENLTLTVLTKKAKETILLKSNWENGNKIKIIPNFIDETVECLDSSEKKIITYIGNISQQKNQKAFLDVIIKNISYFEGRYKVLIVGNIPDNFNIDIYTDNNVIEFTGQIPRASVKKIYEKTILNVLISRVEGFGMSIIEAFEHGIPSVVNSKMEICSMIDDENAIFMINDIDDSNEIFRQIDVALNKKLDKKSIKRLSQSFHKGNIIKKYEKTYFLP